MPIRPYRWSSLIAEQPSASQHSLGSIRKLGHFRTLAGGLISIWFEHDRERPDRRGDGQLSDAAPQPRLCRKQSLPDLRPIAPCDRVEAGVAKGDDNEDRSAASYFACAHAVPGSRRKGRRNGQFRRTTIVHRRRFRYWPRYHDGVRGSRRQCCHGRHPKGRGRSSRPPTASLPPTSVMPPHIVAVPCPAAGRSAAPNQKRHAPRRPDVAQTMHHRVTGDSSLLHVKAFPSPLLAAGCRGSTRGHPRLSGVRAVCKIFAPLLRFGRN